MLGPSTSWSSETKASESQCRENQHFTFRRSFLVPKSKQGAKKPSMSMYSWGLADTTGYRIQPWYSQSFEAVGQSLLVRVRALEVWGTAWGLLFGELLFTNLPGLWEGNCQSTNINFPKNVPQNRQVHFYVKSSIGLSCLTQHVTQTDTNYPSSTRAYWSHERVDGYLEAPSRDWSHAWPGADLPIKVTKFHLKPPSQVGKFPQQLNGFTPSLPRICHEILFL